MSPRAILHRQADEHAVGADYRIFQRDFLLVGDVVGGCANVTTSFKGARSLDKQEISELCGRIGMQLGGPGSATWP